MHRIPSHHLDKKTRQSRTSRRTHAVRVGTGSVLMAGIFTVTGCVGVPDFASDLAALGSLMGKTATLPTQDALGKQDIAKANFGGAVVYPQHSTPSLKEAELLALVNDARATPRLCGGVRYAAAPALKWHDALQKSATHHAEDMAKHGYFEHQDRDGNIAPVRARRAGYPSSYVGENLGVGYTTASLAMAGWLASTSHCQNIMNPNYTHVGIGYAQSPKSRHGRYWVLNLGAVF